MLAVFDKIDLSTLAHEGISYEGIGYLMLIANTVVPGLSLASGLFLMGEDVVKVLSDANDTIVTGFANPMALLEDGDGGEENLSSEDED